MKSSILLLILLISMLGVIGYAMIAVEGGHLPVHSPEQLPGVLQSDARMARDAGMSNVGLLFLILITAVFLVCLNIGIGPRRSANPARVVLVAVGGASLIVAARLLASYVQYANDPTGPLLGPFPAPTTWMIFGIYLVPWAFVAAYVLGFDKWFYTAEDAAHYKVLISNDSESGESGEGGGDEG